MKKNPLTSQPYSDEAKKLQITVNAFPTAKPLVLAQFDKIYKKNDIIIVKAATGTGKGVVLAPRAMILENVKNGALISVARRVVVTEPRTPNTLVAAHLKKVLDAPNLVNYGYRFNNHITPETRLAFVTDGFLVNFFYNDFTLPDYDVVIVDEVHERNKNIDQLLCFLKLSGKKTMLLSATIDVNEFRQYFESPVRDAEILGVTTHDPKIGSMEISGVTHPVKDIFLASEEDYMTQAIRVIQEICKANTDKGDILVFLSSGPELRKACKEIYKIGLDVACMELSAGTQEEARELIVDEHRFRDMQFNGRHTSRKLVFSTNVAESGITVKGITIVIDTGRRYESTFNPEEQIYELQSRFISKAEAEQRRGRAGRTQPGTCYHLYSEEEYEKNFPAYKAPEVLIEEISDIIMSLLNSKFCDDDIKKVHAFLNNMMSPPKDIQVEFAMKLLRGLELIDDTDHLTKMGRNISSIPLSPQAAITMVAAKSYGVDHTATEILAMMEIEPDISKWFMDVRENSPKYKDFMHTVSKWRVDTGEIFVLKDMFEAFMKNGNEAWCTRNYLQFTKLVKARKQFFKLREIAKKILPLFPRVDGTDYERVRQAFIRGHPLNIATRVEGTVYSIDRPAKVVNVEQPTMLKKLGKKILFLDITKINGRISVSNLINL